MNIEEFETKPAKTNTAFTCDGCYFDDDEVYCQKQYDGIVKQLHSIHGHCGNGHIYVKKLKEDKQ